MGFFQDLGLDEIVSSVSEMANELSGLKDDLLGGIQDNVAGAIGEPLSDLQNTVQDITDSVTGGDGSSSS